MPIYKIRGIDVDFPYEAYDCQIVYMEKVIESLQNKCNALLESPTGTGKTLCLLCATLAWRRSLGEFSTGSNRRNPPNSSEPGGSQSQGQKYPMIVYSTRTHSQLRQVVQELKRTNYRPRMVVLGSRDQLCIHDDVRLLRGKAQTNACRFLCRKQSKHKCFNYHGVSGYMKRDPGIGEEPIDIEDLVNIGRREEACPYFISREVHKVVDILFAPYNYLIDRGNRKSLTVEWHNSVLIFDEAHNLESICADASSFDLPYGLLSVCTSEAKKCIDIAIVRKEVEKSNEKIMNPNNYAILRGLLLKLEKHITEIPIESKELGFTRPGPYIYELLADLNITDETATMLIDTIEGAVELLQDAENETERGTHRPKGTICRLESMADILKIIFRNGNEASRDKTHAKSYRFHLREAEANSFDAFKGKASRILSWWCFNPGLAMQAFPELGVGSIILTSGTLSPLDSFAQELKLEFPVRLENPHVISSNQIWAGVVPTGPSGCSFNSKFENRDTLQYKQELGNAIANFARIVPDGLLVFFPSYYIMEQCISCWKNMIHSSSTTPSTIWERISKHKQPVIEPKQASLFLSSIEDFMSKLSDTSTTGAVFFAVCRGKVSEGLDFADKAGRAVVVTGLPFASRNDPKVRLKREFLDQQAVLQDREYKVLTGEEWYNQQASRAVNQAVGRVIRHRHDYGAIIFCDERFAQPNRQSQMSLWLQPHIKCYSKFGEIVYTLTRFFRDVREFDLARHMLAKSVNFGPDPAVKSIVNEGIDEMPEDDTPFVSESSNLVNINANGTQCGDKHLFTKTITHLTATNDCGAKVPISHVLSAKRGNSLIDIVPPANRSTLANYMNKHPLTVNRSRDLFQNQIKVETSDVIDLASNSIWDESQRRREQIVACSSKKSKLLKTNPDATLHSKKQESHEKLYNAEKTHLSSYSVFSNISTKHGKQPQLSSCGQGKVVLNDSNRKVQHVPEGSVIVLDDDGTSEETDSRFRDRTKKGVPSSSKPCDEELRGSAFLTQVQEKLNPREYGEFVGYMKALKSKTMSMSHVLQAIARLFSTPERLILRGRFKDFVHVKCRSMYEQLLIALDAEPDS